MKKKNLGKIIGICFWLIVWQLCSLAVGQELILASPITVIRILMNMIVQGSFWQTIVFSLFRIIGGFFLGVFIGVILSVISAKSKIGSLILSPFLSLLKSVPVASFVIIILFWFGSRNLSLIISFIMVMPVIYFNTLNGIGNIDKKLVQMAEVFQVNWFQKTVFVYFPEILPFFTAGCKVALGLCWKSGIAAELIGIPNGSIGERLYQAKIFLSTGEVFAWTLVIILLSALFEFVFMNLLKRLQFKLENSV